MCMPVLTCAWMHAYLSLVAAVVPGVLLIIWSITALKDAAPGTTTGGHFGTGLRFGRELLEPTDEHTFL